MSRKIKFRVFDNQSKMFLQPEIAGSYCFRYMEDGSRYEIVPSSMYYQFSQFTGLKDKNGKDIFEGDLVNFTLKGFTHEVYPEDIEKAEVWYNDEDAMFCFGRFKTNDLIDYYFSMADRIDKKTLEVIGNIYET